MEHYEKKKSSETTVTSVEKIIKEKEYAIKEKEAYVNSLIDYKRQLNVIFFKQYARFIQEGTWIDEKYYDDENYYNDALSVLYNSCYPQVAY
jgi:hypothetical protein